MDEHQHCQNCIKSHCTEFPQCPVESCTNGCGSSLHRCKWVEHDKHTCPEALVRCTNASYGCKELFLRKVLGKHIQHCPASVIQCHFCYYRNECVPTVECELSYPNSLIDEKLLSVDCNLFQRLKKHDGTPSLDVVVENSAHISMCRSSGIECNGKRRTCTVILQQPTFHCNRIVRRDEYAVHWKNIHIDIQLDSSERIRRCPLQKYGCTYGQYNLVPYPMGSYIGYDKEEDFFSFVPTTTCIEASNAYKTQSSYSAKIQEKKELALYGYGEEEDEESYDVLGQLPVEVLLVILGSLDSLSLWNLSQVNHYLRKMCSYVVKKQGIVYFKWEKDTNSELPWTQWRSTPKVWSFSTVTSSISSWLYTDVPSISAHMMSCDTYKSISKVTHDQMKMLDVLEKQSSALET